MEQEELAARLNDLREEITDNIDQVVEELSGENAEQLQKRKVRLLKEVYDQGGTVTQEEFHEIGQDLGYDKRGLGGLFAWQGKGARLQKVKKLDGTEMVLTQEGVEYLKKKDAIEEEN